MSQSRVRFADLVIDAAGYLAACTFTAFVAFRFRKPSDPKGAQTPEEEVII